MNPSLYQGRYEIECGTAALEVPFQQINSCVRMKSAVGIYPDSSSLRFLMTHLTVTSVSSIHA